MAYLAKVQHALVLLGFVVVSVGCGPGVPPVRTESSAPVVAAAAPPALPTGCRAEPETVYGQEPVVFQIQAERPTTAQVALRDSKGAPLREALVPAPGVFQPADVPSGDFTLQLGPNLPGCSVTVNREQARASQAAR